MRIGLVVGPACGLPQNVIRKHNIVILPITIGESRLCLI